MRSSFSIFLLYHAYVYFGFPILACTIYILTSNRSILPLAVSLNNHPSFWYYYIFGKVGDISPYVRRMTRQFQKFLRVCCPILLARWTLPRHIYCGSLYFHICVPIPDINYHRNIKVVFVVHISDFLLSEVNMKCFTKRLK